MNALPTLPTLGGTKPKKKMVLSAPGTAPAPTTPGVSATQPPASTGAPTFASLQASGQARPAPAPVTPAPAAPAGPPALSQESLFPTANSVQAPPRYTDPSQLPAIGTPEANAYAEAYGWAPGSDPSVMGLNPANYTDQSVLAGGGGSGTPTWLGTGDRTPESAQSAYDQAMATYGLAGAQGSGAGLPGANGQQSTSGLNAQLMQMVQQSLASPSRYDANTFKAIRDPAVADLKNQYARIRDDTETSLARRGLSASTYGANDLYDVDSAQSRALADLDAGLLRDAAATQSADRQQAFGMGNTLAGNAESTRQFDLTQALNERLGVGNLQLNKDQLAQQFEQFKLNLDLQNRQLTSTETTSRNNALMQMALAALNAGATVPAWVWQMLGISPPGGAATTTGGGTSGGEGVPIVTPPGGWGGGYGP